MTLAHAVILPFVLALVIAYLLTPLVAWVEKKRVPRAAAIILVYVVVLGTLGAAACVPLYLATGEEIFKALAFTGFFLNLFNLVPVTPLDGGRAMAALSPWMWFAGLFAFALLAFISPNPIIVIILVLGAFDTYKRFKAYRAGGAEVRSYYRVPRRQRLMVLAVYLCLIAVLVVGMDLTHLARDFSNV